MESYPPKATAVQEESMNRASAISDSSLTAKDGLLIATECHLALFPDEDGDTALHLAVVQGDVEACRKVVELFHIARKSIDVHNNLLQTPLHVAVIMNQKEIIKLLINHGSNPDYPDRYGSTTFHLCAKYNHLDCLVEIFSNIGSRKLGLNIRDYDGLTALHVAVRYGSVDTFKLLVANGADIDAKDNKGGRTPLIYAIEMNERTMVEMLLESDASVCQQTYSGDTALHIASGRGLQEIVRLLLRRGADATVKNTHSETPMSLATSPSVSDILKTQHGRMALSSANVMADTQYASYIARNVAVPMPPHYLTTFNPPVDDNGLVGDAAFLQRRGRKFKRNFCDFSSDEATPPKRPVTTDPIAPLGLKQCPSKGLDKNGECMRHEVEVKREYNDQIAETVTNLVLKQDWNLTSVGDSAPESKDDDDVPRKVLDSFEEGVDITMEEVEVSAEEEVHTRSDDENVSLMGQNEQKICVNIDKQPYTHKLMQYSLNTLGDKVNNENSMNNANVENKPVIVPKQPQIDMSAAISQDYQTNFKSDLTQMSFTRNPSPGSTFSQGLAKSKSVPSSPQPAEANLFQLAREGLAVAAMANSSSSHQSPDRDFGLSSYLKARPSRQAKIKSGTEELQNLALQGLAVAAMNARSQLQRKTKKVKAAEVSDCSPNRPMALKSLDPGLIREKDDICPLLHRSNSLPPKQYLETELFHKSFPTSEKSGLPNLSSNHTLLAFAHANALKEHVDQAVSAISLAKMPVNSTAQFQQGISAVSISSSNVLNSTKQNLRQAIMVKSTSITPPASQNVQKVREIFDARPKKFLEVYDPNNLGLKLYDPRQEFTSTTISSLKILPSTPIGCLSSIDVQKDKTSSAFPSPCSTLPATVAVVNSHSQRAKTPEPLAVFDISISRRVEASQHACVDSTYLKTTMEGNVEPSLITLPHAKLINTKPVKNPAPTLITVAPLQMVTGKGMPIITRQTENDKQQTLISVAMAPVVTSRVLSPPASNQAQAATTHQQTTELDVLTAGSTSQNRALPIYATVPRAALGLQAQHFLDPTLANSGVIRPHTSSPYLQPRIVYVPHGKDLIPILMPPTAFPPQVQIPQYSTLLYQQSLLLQGNPNLLQSSTVGAVAKPVAAVSAVPVKKGAGRLPRYEGATKDAEEQPLNLSKKTSSALHQIDQPLNLMKTGSNPASQSEDPLRSSVITVVSSIQSEVPKAPCACLTAAAPAITVTSSFGERQVPFYFPPPVIINPGSVSHSTQPPALSALSLPPIHYVNGMPIVFGLPPPEL